MSGYDHRIITKQYRVSRGNPESTNSVQEQWINTEEDPNSWSCLADSSSEAPTDNSNETKNEYFITKHLHMKHTHSDWKQFCSSSLPWLISKERSISQTNIPGNDNTGIEEKW